MLVENSPQDYVTEASGGGFGSIIGCNSFQRDQTALLSLLGNMFRIYKGDTQ
jgi:hypothetical protein